METDWLYHMRREMQEVLPGLFLGPFNAATKSKFSSLLDHGITHIICIRQDIEAHMIRPNFPHKIKYLIIDMADSCLENLISHISECRDFIDECLAAGGKCLVHGNLGISRSAAVVIAYVMEKKMLTYKEALEFVQNRRYCINPNDGFKHQLIEYEAIYKAQQTLMNGQCSQEKGKLKRKLDQSFDEFDQDSSEPMEAVS
ncbi:serine/threonine/tyrosine-interacting protein B-like [Macrobrachium rosenbergii]|uniref:serine/threonine/tyrosine-interacting protein B-like n=1 Tax=Macrobrachium rosenbergii TaxID=79674 RepID=UPI0034D6CF6D